MTFILGFCIFIISSIKRYSKTCVEIDVEYKGLCWAPSLEIGENEFNDGTYFGTIRNIKTIFEKNNNCKVKSVRRDAMNDYWNLYKYDIVV